MKDLTRGNIYKTFILFAIPMVLSGVLSQCYSIINTIIAGKLLGDNALAAIGAISPLETFVNSIFWGYGTGVGIYTAHLFGAGKYPHMKSVIVNNFKLITSSVLLLSGVLLMFRHSIYGLLNVDPSILDACNRYFIISISGRALVLFSINCVYVVNAIGDSGFPFLMSVLSTILNITIGVISITVFHFGVEGLALGNVLSSIAVDILYSLKLSSCFQNLGINKEKTPMNIAVIKETCKYSISSMIQQSIMYFAGLLLSPMLNSLGSAASASYTVTLRIYDINAAIYQNSAKTLGNYTAQCYGAKKYHLLKKGLIVGFIQNLLFVAPTLIISIVFSRQVTMLFYTSSATTTSLDYTVTFLKYCLPFLVFNIVANLFHNFFRGIGHMTALMITTITGSFVRILISFLLITPYGIYGYYAGWIFAWVFDAIVGIIIYSFGKWRLKTKSA